MKAIYYHPDYIRERHRGHFFDPSAMRFFNSRISDTGYSCDGGETIYFVTSERFSHYTDRGTQYEPRRYTVRKWTRTTDQIDTVGDFQQYATSGGAGKAAQRAAEFFHRVP